MESYIIYLYVYVCMYVCAYGTCVCIGTYACVYMYVHTQTYTYGTCMIRGECDLSIGSIKS